MLAVKIDAGSDPAVRGVAHDRRGDRPEDLVVPVHRPFLEPVARDRLIPFGPCLAGAEGMPDGKRHVVEQVVGHHGQAWSVPAGLPCQVNDLLHGGRTAAGIRAGEVPEGGPDARTGQQRHEVLEARGAGVDLPLQPRSLGERVR